MRVTPAYIAAGANRASSCSAVNSAGLVAYGAGNAVALWNCDPSSTRGVHATLVGHAAPVTVVKLVRDESSAYLSGDAQGGVRLWQEVDGRMACTVRWSAHAKHSLSALASVPAGPLADLVLTGASDGVVKVWRISGAAADLIQTIDLKGRLPLAMEVAQLPGSSAPVLVIGVTDRNVRIYTHSPTGFTHTISLEGHEDWVRCVSIASVPSDGAGADEADLLLATGSQDNYIRLWRIAAVRERISAPEGQASAVAGPSKSNGLDMLDEFERKLAGEGGSTQISTKAHVLAVEESGVTKRYNVTLEALLIGHESGLTNLHWSPPSPSSTTTPHLLSTATDNSLILWTPSSAGSSSNSNSGGGMWIPAHRFGAVGGRGLAFYGALWGPRGESVLASGWTGGWERWVRTADGGWVGSTGVSGHYADVPEVLWSPDGEYLMSLSTDQTTRIHAQTTIGESSRWAEIARPQVHGYDMTCATWLGRFRFASGADEKVTRVFDAPAGFVGSLAGLGVHAAEADAESRPKGATVPPLGLSNRALGRIPDAPEIPVQARAQDSVSQVFDRLPTEEELATSTLWPEVEKVYGHGYELVSMAADPTHSLLATACKANTTEHAAVRLHDTTSWDAVGRPLEGHTLTVTRIAFEPAPRAAENGAVSRTGRSRLLTVSRDRSWRLWAPAERARARGEGGAEGVDGYECVAVGDKAHARMILDGCWVRAEGWEGFVTASRDKSVKIWTSSVEGQWVIAASISLEHGASAVDALEAGGRAWLAVGDEAGGIGVYELQCGSQGEGMITVQAELRVQFDPAIAHVQGVTRLAFRPLSEDAAGLQLASASDDRSVRVYDLDL